MVFNVSRKLTITLAMDAESNIHTANAGCINSSSSSRNKSVIIQADDVLYGKGKDVFNHPGNSRFREIILTSIDTYLKCKNSNDRLTLAERVVQLVESRNGGRFLRRNHVINSWVPMNHRQIQDKIMNAFRDATKKVPSASISNIASSSFGYTTTSNDSTSKQPATQQQHTTKNSSKKRERPSESSTKDDKDARMYHQKLEDFIMNTFSDSPQKIQSPLSFANRRAANTSIDSKTRKDQHPKKRSSKMGGCNEDRSSPPAKKSASTDPRSTVHDSLSPILSYTNIIDLCVSSSSATSSPTTPRKETKEQKASKNSTNLDFLSNSLFQHHHHPNLLQSVQVVAAPVAVLYVPPANDISFQQSPIVLNMPPSFCLSGTLPTLDRNLHQTTDLLQQNQSLLRQLEKKASQDPSMSFTTPHSSSVIKNSPVPTEFLQQEWNRYKDSKFNEQYFKSRPQQRTKKSTKLSSVLLHQSNSSPLSSSRGAARIREVLRRSDSCSSEED